MSASELPHPIRELVETLASASDWHAGELVPAVHQWRADGLLATLVVDDHGELWTLEVAR